MTEVAIPESVDAAARDAARDVLADAPRNSDVLALCSFGHDSLTAAHLAANSRLGLDGVVHVNTGIGVPETRAFGIERTRQLGLDYHEVGRYDPALGAHEYRLATQEYDHLVTTFGFPGPNVHKWMYLNLKQNPLEWWLNEHYPDREVTLVSGVRRHESDRRMENVDEQGRQTYLGAPTVSPLVEFTGLDVTRYRRDLDLPSNPVVDALEMSGECLCGAYASRGELRLIRLFYPATYRRLLGLQARVRAAAALDDGPDPEYARWGHGRLQDRERRAMDDDAQMLLCESCERRATCEQSPAESPAGRSDAREVPHTVAGEPFAGVDKP